MEPPSRNDGACERTYAELKDLRGGVADTSTLIYLENLACCPLSAMAALCAHPPGDYRVRPPARRDAPFSRHIDHNRGRCGCANGCPAGIADPFRGWSSPAPGPAAAASPLQQPDAPIGPASARGAPCKRMHPAASDPPRLCPLQFGGHCPWRSGLADDSRGGRSSLFTGNGIGHGAATGRESTRAPGYWPRPGVHRYPHWIGGEARRR